MLIASSCDKICQAKRREVTRQPEDEEETKVRLNTTQKGDEGAEKPQNEDTRHHLVSE